MPDKPFAMIFAAFADPASFKRVPITGIELAVPAPSYRPKPGGLGWDDIEGLLSEADRDPDYDRNHSFPLSDGSSQVQKHIFVRVSVASEYFGYLDIGTAFNATSSEKEISFNPIPAPDVPTAEMQRQIAEKFVQWAETKKPLRPISNSLPISERELFGNSELDNVRLRVALRWAGRALGKRTSFETYNDAPGKELHDTQNSVKPSESDTLEGDAKSIQSTLDK